MLLPVLCEDLRTAVPLLPPPTLWDFIPGVFNQCTAKDLRRLRQKVLELAHSCFLFLSLAPSFPVFPTYSIHFHLNELFSLCCQLSDSTRPRFGSFSLYPVGTNKGLPWSASLYLEIAVLYCPLSTVWKQLYFIDFVQFSTSAVRGHSYRSYLSCVKTEANWIFENIFTWFQQPGF